MFKFPQMDFEMAIWEMTSLLIAPKKVFRSIYYHVRSTRANDVELADRRNRNVSCNGRVRSRVCGLITLPIYRNEEYMAPPRPVLHIPPLLLHAPHWPCMGRGVCRDCCWGHPLDIVIPLCALPSPILGCVNGGLLLCGTISGPRHPRLAWAKETAGVVHRSTRSRLVGVWVLLRCEAPHITISSTSELKIGIQVSIRAFFPVWVFLYVLQFILWPLISQRYW